MSLMHHPDKPGGSNEKFQEVSCRFAVENADASRVSTY